MRRVLAAGAVLLLALGHACFSPNTALAIGRAAPASKGSQEELAVGLAKAGRELFDQGRFKEALASFQEAASLARSPVIDLYVARCHRNLGALVVASELYARVSKTALADGAPEAFVSAVADAKKELEQLVARIPKATFRLENAEGAELRVDGSVVSAVAELPLDPGAHRADLFRDGKQVGSSSFELANGQTLEVVLTGAGAPTPKEALITADATPDTGATEGSLLPGIIVTSAGGLGLLLGAITGGLAISKESELAELCAGAQCPASVQGDIDEANLLATVSTVGFIAGGVISAVGITLLIIRPGGGDAPAASVSAGFGSARLTVPF